MMGKFGETAVLQNKNVGKSILAGNVLLVGCGCHFAWAFNSLSNTWFYTPHFLIAIFFIGIIAGAITAAFLYNKSRRKSILASSVFLGLSGYCFLHHSDSYLLTGRFLSGFSFSVTYVTLMVFIGEVSQNEFRGRHIVCINLSIYLGCFLQYCFTVISDGYFLAKMSMICSFLSLIFIYYMKESPYLLTLNGNEKEALNNLIYYRKNEGSKNATDREFNEIKKQTYKNSSREKLRSIYDICHENRGKFVIIFMTKLIQMLTFSIPFTETHLWIIPTIYVDYRPGSVTWKLIILYIGKILGTISCMKTIDKSNKINLFLKSLNASIICLVILLLAVIINWEFDFESSILYTPFIVLAIMEYYIGLGVGSVPDAILGESFPLHLSSLAASLSTIIFALIHVIFYYVVLHPFRWGGDLGTCFYCLVYIICLVFKLVGFIFIRNFGKTFNEHKFVEGEALLLNEI